MNIQIIRNNAIMISMCLNDQTKKAWKSLVCLEEEREPWRNKEAFRADACISIAHRDVWWEVTENADNEK